MKEIGHPVHPKCIFWTQFWNSSFLKALLSHLMYTDVGPLLTCVCHIRNTTLNFLSHLKQIAYKVNVTLNSHKKYLKPVFSSEMHIQKQCSLSTFFHEKCWRIELEAIHNQPDLSKSNLQIFITVAVLVIEKFAPS